MPCFASRSITFALGAPCLMAARASETGSPPPLAWGDGVVPVLKLLGPKPRTGPE